MPEGFVKLSACEVWTDGSKLVIFGDPPDEDAFEDEAMGHDCDLMGCGSVGPHVIAMGHWCYGDPIQRA